MAIDQTLARAFEATWPAAEYRDLGGFRIGRGLGGGGRISSALALGPDWQEDAIPAVARIQKDWDQIAQFRVWEDDTRLTEALARHGYGGLRPTELHVVEISRLTDRVPPPLTAFEIWPPLAIQREIWAEGNISTPRQAAMERVTLPRTALLGRLDDHASGAAFVAVDGDVAMIHAVEVAPKMRRRGMAEWLVRQAAIWGAAQGARRLALAMTASNAPAAGLYGKLGFEKAASYRYWEHLPAKA